MHENHLVVGGIASGGSRPWANGGGGGGGGGAILLTLPAFLPLVILLRESACSHARLLTN